MILSLDTNVLVDIINDRPDVRARYDAAAEDGAQLLTSSVAACELHFGALISRRPKVQRSLAEALLADLSVEAWTQDDAQATARIKQVLRTRGTPVGAYDVMIAGQAVNRGWTVVSHNLRDFSRIDGLSVIDWTDVADKAHS